MKKNLLILFCAVLFCIFAVSASADAEFTVKCSDGSYQVYIFVTLGENINIQAFVSGTNLSDLTYQWYSRPMHQFDNDRDYVPLPGETGNILVQTPSIATDYRCVVTDQNGNSASCVYKVLIENDLQITSDVGQQNGRNNCVVRVEEGKSVILHVDVSSAAQNDNFTYDWRRAVSHENGGTQYGDTLSDSDTCQTPAITQNAQYRVAVTDKFGNYAFFYFTVNVNNELKVTCIDGSTKMWLSAFPEEEVTLQACVTARDVSGCTYQWHSRSMHQFDDERDFTPIPGETNEMLTASASIAMDYRCMVTDRYGNTRSCVYKVRIENNLWVVSDLGTLSGSSIRVLTIEPGESVLLHVDVTSASPDDTFTYDWRRAVSYENGGTQFGDPLSDTNTCQTPAITQYELYRVAVRDKFGNYEYLSFRIFIENDFTVTCDDGSSYSHQTIMLGQEMNMRANVSARNMNEISYQWYTRPMHQFTNNANYIAISGAMSDTLTVTPSIASDFRCVVADIYGNVKECVYKVYIENHFRVSSSVGTSMGDGQRFVQVPEGETANLSVTATSSSEDDIFTYEWRIQAKLHENGGVEFGPILSTEEVFVTPPVTERHIYTVFVKDNYGNITSLSYQVSPDIGIRIEPGSDRFPVVPKNTEITMVANVTSSETLAIKWYQYSVGASRREEIIGETSPTLTTTVTKNSNYIMIATDSYGTEYVLIFAPATQEFVNSVPQKPTATSIETGVLLEWEALDEASFYDVQRRTSGTDWQTLERLPINRLAFGDSAVKPGMAYQYRIIGGYAGPHLTKPSESTEITFGNQNTLYLPEDLTRIEAETFTGVAADAVFIPPSVTEIALDAFDPDIIIIGEAGSEAEAFALQNGFTFQER